MKPHYQHPIHGSSCRLWDCTDYTPVSFYLWGRTACSHLTGLCWMMTERPHTCSTQKIQLCFLWSKWIIYCFCQSGWWCNACVNNISHSQRLISFEMIQNTDDSYDSCSLLLFFEDIFPDALGCLTDNCLFWQTVAAAVCQKKCIHNMTYQLLSIGNLHSKLLHNIRLFN